MYHIIWIINPGLVTPANFILNIDSKGLEKPMPHPFNWCVVHAAHLQCRWEPICGQAYGGAAEGGKPSMGVNK